MDITVLTPTYNRGELLPKIYQSMVEQDNHSFQWLIIDDGSQDNTKEIVEDLKNNHKSSFSISYIQKKNGGKHSALNYSHPFIKGKYVMVLDSDDYLRQGSIQIIINTIKQYESIERLGWIAFLKGNEDNSSQDVPYSENYGITNYMEYMNEGRKGECCDVYLTKVFQDYPYPEIDGEKFLSESYLNIQAAKYGRYKMLTVNEVIQVVSYLDEGLTGMGRKLQLNNPIGNAELWRHVSGGAFSKKIQLKGTLLYSVYSLFGKKRPKEIIANSLDKSRTRLMFLFSLVLYIYWRIRYR